MVDYNIFPDFYQLVPNLYYLKNQPDAIPYITSYYKRNWGFCLSYNDFKKMNRDTTYKVLIDSDFDSNGVFCCHERFFQDLEEKRLFFTNNSETLGGYSFKNRCSRLSSLLKKGFKIEGDTLIFWLKKLEENQKFLRSNKIPKINTFKVLKY